MKKGVAIYHYLNALGVLETGTTDDIAKAKKAYWASVRSAWKAKQRQEKKGYTIFLEEEEVSQIKKIIGAQKSGVAGYIKEATRAAIANTHVTDKKTVGEIRACLYSFYNKINADTNNIPASTTKALLHEIELLQYNILSILQTKTK